MVWFDLDIGSRNEQKWYSSAHVPFSGALLSTYMVEVANYIRAPGSRSLYSTGILEVDRRKLSLVENARDSGGYGKHWGNALSQAKLLTSFAKHCDGGLMRQLIHPIFSIFVPLSIYLDPPLSVCPLYCLSHRHDPPAPKRWRRDVWRWNLAENREACDHLRWSTWRLGNSTNIRRKSVSRIGRTVALLAQAIVM